MVKKRYFMVMIGVSCTVGHSVQAQSPSTILPPSSQSIEVKRPYLRVGREDASQTLAQWISARRLREEEIDVIRRLQMRKQAVLARINRQLEERFGVLPDGLYQYDSETKTLYRYRPRPVSDKQGEKKGWFNVFKKKNRDEPSDGPDETAFDKTVQQRFSDEDEQAEFLQLIKDKNLATHALQILQLLLEEKQLEFAKINASLEEQFGLPPEKNYEYDEQRKILYERIRLDGPASTLETNAAIERPTLSW